MGENNLDRIVVVNRIIEKIAGCGRRFFWHRDQVCYMFLSKGIVFIHSAHAGDVEVFQDKPLKEHIGGGTLEGLVKDFANYIHTGEYSNHKNGYGGLYCPHWGYPESDMLDIQNFARELGYLTDSRP